MLVELMAEIEKGGTLEVNQLARRLNTSPGMIFVMMEHLQKNGFIKTYENCGDGCGSCSLGSMCDHAVGNGVSRIWQFEENSHEKK
jgi:hypothetical protein